MEVVAAGADQHAGHACRAPFRKSQTARSRNTASVHAGPTQVGGRAKPQGPKSQGFLREGLQSVTG